MSDLSNGPGWWVAADGKWYPPELHPGYVSPRQPPALRSTRLHGFRGSATASSAFLAAGISVLVVGGVVTWRLLADMAAYSATTRLWVGATSAGATILVASGLVFFALALQLLRSIAVSCER